MQTEQPASKDANCCLLQELYVRRCVKCGDTSGSQGFQDPASHSSGNARLNPTCRQPQVKYDRILDTVVFSIHSGHEFVTRETAWFKRSSQQLFDFVLAMPSYILPCSLRALSSPSPMPIYFFWFYNMAPVSPPLSMPSMPPATDAARHGDHDLAMSKKYGPVPEPRGLGTGPQGQNAIGFSSHMGGAETGGARAQLRIIKPHLLPRPLSAPDGTCTARP